MAQIEWKNAGNGVIVEAFEFELRLPSGFEPGEGRIRLGAGAFEELESSGEVALRVTFADETPKTDLTVKSLYLTDYTRKTDESGTTIYAVKIHDRRIRWKRFGEVSIYANCQFPGGRLDQASLKAGSQYTWRDLVLLCIEAMGETPYLTGGDALPENPFVPRNIRWAGKNAAEALQELLEPAGYTVALHYDGKFEVVKRGEAIPRTIPTGYGPTRHTGKLFSLVPGSIQVVGAPIVNETTVELESCALDTDGQVRALGNISYLAGLDVEHELATNFASLHDKPAVQAAARLSVGHYFRIPKTAGYADEGENTNYRLVPVLLGHEAGAAPVLEGAYFERVDKRRYRNAGAKDDLVRFTKGFSVIDPARGLVFTQKICGILTETEINVLPCMTDSGPLKIEIVAPKLTFRHYQKEPGGALKRFRYNLGEGSAILTLNRLDLKLLCINGVPDPAVFSDIQARAQELAQAQLSVPATLNIEKGVYAGCHPLKCDGVVAQVSWYADHAFCTSSYTYGPPADISPQGCEDLPGCLAVRPAHAAAVPTDHELRLTNANKHGPIPIRSSDTRRAMLAAEGRRDDTEDCLFAELDGFDEIYQEPALIRLAPPERHNWRHRDHSPTPNPSPDGQDTVWTIQLISDDKYMIEKEVNRSTAVVRLCDENTGDLDDIWRVRSVPSEDDIAADMEQRDDTTRVKLISTNEAYRLMWLINTVTGGEGGWITDVPPEGLGLEKLSDEKAVSPPRRIGQIGDIVILTQDDEIVQTRDGDLFTYANIRHDAHFHKTDQKDGRIRFADTAPGTRPSQGTLLVGEMICDPAVKNTETNLGKESGQWCPQVQIPYLDGFSDDTVPAYFGEGGA